MSKASKLVSNAIIGVDYIIVYVSGKAYPVHPPTIHRLAGAISCISDLEFSDSATLKDMLLSAKDCKAYAKALSWFIKGNYYCPLNFWVRYKFRADTSHEVSALFVIFAFVPKLR